MHKFMDQLLSNAPSKKRTQTQTGREIVSRNSQHQRMQQLIELERKDSQPLLYSSEEYQKRMVNQQNGRQNQESEQKQGRDESSEYEAEEVTEQILFEDDGGEMRVKKVQGSVTRMKESQAQFKASDQQFQGSQQQQEKCMQVLRGFQYKQQGAQKNEVNKLSDLPTINHYAHASNRRQTTLRNESVPYQQHTSQIINLEGNTNYPSIRSVTNNHQKTMNNNNERSITNNNERISINIITVEGIINGIRNAKQSHMELINWFQFEKQSFVEFINIVIANIQSQIVKFLSKPNTPQKLQLNSQQQLSSSQRKWQIEKKLIKQQLQQRYQYRLQKLEQQLEQQRKYSEQLINTYHQTHKPESIRSSRTVNYNTPLHIDQELQFVRKQLFDKDHIINELQTEMQKLNQHIFDVEQKVQGIELEVENRVREKVKLLQIEHQKTLNQIKNTHSTHSLHPNNNLLGESSPITQLNPILETSSHLQQSSHLFGLQSMHHSFPNNHLHQQLTELQLQNQHLKKMVIQLQQEKNSTQLQMRQQEKIIAFREEQIKKNQEDIAFEWAQVDKDRHATFRREQELATAQQNISRKISQIRTKQIDLDRWQTQLQKRQLALDLRQHQINQKLQQIVHQSNLQKQLINKHKQLNNNNKPKDNITQNQRQSISIPSNQNRLSRQNIQDFYTEGGGGSFRPNGIDIPQLPLGQKNYQHSNFKQEKSFDLDHSYRNKPFQILSKANFQKSFEDPDRSYTRQNISRQRMIITSTNFRSNRANGNSHQYVLPQTSNVQRHSRSKSRSKEKPILRNNLFHGSSSISTTSYKNPSLKGKQIDDYYQNKNNSNLDGLGSKLERLRDEIKREIDSIK